MSHLEYSIRKLNQLNRAREQFLRRIYVASRDPGGTQLEFWIIPVASWFRRRRKPSLNPSNKFVPEPKEHTKNPAFWREF